MLIGCSGGKASSRWDVVLLLSVNKQPEQTLEAAAAFSYQPDRCASFIIQSKFFFFKKNLRNKTVFCLKKKNAFQLKRSSIKTLFVYS